MRNISLRKFHKKDLEDRNFGVEPQRHQKFEPQIWWFGICDLVEQKKQFDPNVKHGICEGKRDIDDMLCPEYLRSSTATRINWAETKNPGY